MTSAVIIDNVTKRFVKPGLPLRKSVSGLGGRAAGGFSLFGNILEINALERVSFQVIEAEIFGLVGGPGSGKSTLIRLLAGRFRPDEGEIKIFGSDLVHQLEQCLRWVNWISFEAGFFKQYSVLENLVLGVRKQKEEKYAALQRAEEILMKLELDEKLIHLPMEALCQEQLQKVTVARALLDRPRLLLLDEPTRGLDEKSRMAVYELIKEMRAETGSTVLLTCRDPLEMEQLCDRMAVLEEGRLIDLDKREYSEMAVPFRLQNHPVFSGCFNEISHR